MGEFQSFGKITTSSGAATVTKRCKGTLALVDIVPKSSTSFDITIRRVLPDGSTANIYVATGVTSLRTLKGSDFLQNPMELAGNIQVVIANAGNHDDALRVYMTMVKDLL